MIVISIRPHVSIIIAFVQSHHHHRVTVRVGHRSQRSSLSRICRQNSRIRSPSPGLRRGRRSPIPRRVASRRPAGRWAGGATDTCMYTSIYFTIYVYNVREVLHTIKKSTSSSRNQSIMHSFIRRDVERETGDEGRGDRETTSRENTYVRASRRRRDETSANAIHARARCRENPFSETEKSTREDSFIHSVRFGSVTRRERKRGSAESRDGSFDVDGLVRDACDAGGWM